MLLNNFFILLLIIIIPIKSSANISFFLDDSDKVNKDYDNSDNSDNSDKDKNIKLDKGIGLNIPERPAAISVNNIAVTDIFSADLELDATLSSKSLYQSAKFNSANRAELDISFSLKSDYINFNKIQNIQLYNYKNQSFHKIKLGLELSSQYFGYVGVSHDNLLATKFDNNYAIKLQDYYQDNSGKFIEDYYFLNTYYKTPSIFGLTLYGEFSVHDNQYTQALYSNNRLAIIDNIAKTEILDMQQYLNDRQYFNYQILSDQQAIDIVEQKTAYIIDFGINYKLDIGTKTKQNNSFHLEMDVSAILARVKPEISTQILEDMQDFLNISKQDFDNIRNDEIMKINSGFAMQWNMNTLLLDSINISGGYSFVQKFLYSAADQFGIINDSMVDSLSNYKFNDSDFKPNLYRMIYELNDKLNLAFANSNSHIKQGIAFLDVTTKIQQSLGGAEGLINQMTLEQLVGFQGSQIAAQDAYARGEIIICQSGQSYCAAYEATLFIADYSAVFFNYSTDPFLLSTVAEYKKQSKLYERYLVYQPTFDKIDIKKYSNTMHHIVNGSIKLEKFGFFLNNSMQYMIGEQALYQYNIGASLVSYNVLRIDITFGYQFNSLMLDNDNLNLNINVAYNMNNFIDNSDYYVIGLGVKYDL